MRFSTLGRLAVVVAAVFCGSCDSATSANGGPGRATVAFPKSLITAPRVAGQTDPGALVVSLRVRISLAADGRQLHQELLNANTACPDANEESVDVCTLSITFPIPAGVAPGAQFQVVIDALGPGGI